MSYCSLALIKNRISEAELIRLTDDTDSDLVDEAKVTAACDDASAEIDSYLVSAYSVPLTDVPVYISSLAVDIAIYNLYALDEANSVPEPREKRYKQALAVLKRYQDGELTLGSQTTDSAAGDTIELASSGRVFTRNKLRAW